MARPLSIQFDDAQLLAIGQEIEEQLNTEIAEEVKVSTLHLKLAAVEFLTVANKTIDAINQYNSLQLIQSNARKAMKEMVPVDPLFEEQYQQTAQKIKGLVETHIFDEFFRAMMIFNDKVLQIITGASMTTVIVVEGDNGPEIREYDIKELLDAGTGVSFMADYESHTHTLVGRIKINTTQLTKAITTISEKDQKKYNFNLLNLNQAYTDAKGDFLKHNPHAFFRPANQKNWFKIKIAGGLGDISEAYTAFFFLKKPPFQDPRWTNLTTYFLEGVANVDNVSGLYTADVIDEENKRNYAIKAANASLPGYKQMITLANNILNQTKNWDVSKLRQISEQKQYKYVNGEKVRKGLRNIVEEVLDFMGDYGTGS